MKIRLIEAPLAVPRYRQVRLPTVAAELTPYAEVEINDPNIEPVDYSEVDLVGFTAQTYNAPRAIYLAKRLREMGIRSIVGGPYPTTVGERALEYFDAAVVGEVEGLGERICRDFERGELRGIYQNEQPPDLSICRLPRRDLQQASKYYSTNFPIEFSRGCPHRCSFCYSQFGFPTFRTRPLDDIARDLEQWDKGYIEAVDMHFAGDREHLLEVCRLLEGARIWGWWGEATLRSLDDEEVLQALEHSNCKQVFVGIESVEETALAASNKSFNKVGDYKRIIRMAQDHGILIHAGIMWGLDGATPESFESTARFCEEVGMYLVSTNIVTFFPGTPAHEKLVEERRITTTDLRDYDSTRVTVAPEGMSVEEVYSGARRFLERFYSYESIFRRSFNNANYRLAQLWGFVGLNLIYRAYFKVWARRMGATDIPWPASPEERESFPHVGGRMPVIYGIAEWEGRLFTYLHKAWDRVPTVAATAPVLVLALALATLSAVFFGVIRWLAVDHWPLPWPPTWAGLTAFAGTAVIGTWLVGRLACVQASKVTLLLGLGAAITPMVLCIQALPEYVGLLRFACAWIAVTFFLKAWSVLSTGELTIKSPFRVVAFLWYFPTLDFAGSFRLEGTKAMLIRHFPLMGAGFVRFCIGLLLAAGLFWTLFFGYGEGAWLPLAFLGRVVVLYLLLRGSLEYWTAYWRMAGYIIERPFGRRPFGPCGPGELWRAWNRPLYVWLLRHVYIPLGGNRRPVFATLVTFAASSAILGAMLMPVVLRFPWELSVFFCGQGLVVAVEKILAARTNSRWVPRVLYLVSGVLFFGSAPWLAEMIDRIVI